MPIQLRLVVGITPEHRFQRIYTHARALHAIWCRLGYFSRMSVPILGQYQTCGRIPPRSSNIMDIPGYEFCISFNCLCWCRSTLSYRAIYVFCLNQSGPSILMSLFSSFLACSDRCHDAHSFQFHGYARNDNLIDLSTNHLCNCRQQFFCCLNNWNRLFRMPRGNRFSTCHV